MGGCRMSLRALGKLIERASAESALEGGLRGCDDISLRMDVVRASCLPRLQR